MEMTRFKTTESHITWLVECWIIAEENLSKWRCGGDSGGMLRWVARQEAIVLRIQELGFRLDATRRQAYKVINKEKVYIQRPNVKA